MSNSTSTGQRKVDVAIIGAGTAGLAAYRAAAEHTDNLLLIESGAYGTTCARVGCMPSKLLIAAADAAHHQQHTSLFGIADQQPIIDGKQVMARVKSERDRFAGFVVDSVESFPDNHKLRGRAEFVSPHVLSVKTDQGTVLIEADRIVIATGSRPTYPAFFNQAEDRLVVNDDVFEWDDLPESVAVFGPGVIGLELGQALSRLGVRVRVFGVGGSVGPLVDPDIKAYAEKTFHQEFYLDPDAKVHSIQRVQDGVSIEFDLKAHPGERHQETFDYLLAATGRTANIDTLNIANSGLVLNDRGIPELNPFTLQAKSIEEEENGNPATNPTSSHIFVAGDANNYIPLLHEAADEGRIAGGNAGQFPTVFSGKRRTPIGVVFTSPQMMTVGLNIRQVEERCQHCFEVGEVSFEDQGSSRVMGVNQGLLKVYAEQGTGLFLGAEMIGPSAEHIAHLLSWAAQQRMTVPQMLEMPFYHPVIEEGVRTALRDVNAKLNLGPAMIERCLDCGPGA